MYRCVFLGHTKRIEVLHGSNQARRFNHRYTTPNRDWKRITRTKIGVFRISIHVALLLCLLQRLDARQTNKNVLLIVEKL